MLPLLAVAMVGLVADPRLVTGAPAWLKPAKFAVSVAIYCLTLAWTFTFIPEWRNTKRWVGAIAAFVFVLELAIINLQAWRGTASHFNVSTTLNTVLFSVMGTAIGLQTLTSIAVVVALWRQRFSDKALGWSLRLGLAISIVGSSTGGLMTRPTAEQRVSIADGHRPTLVGAHTVGAPDGGAGFPGTGWSTEHGDIRVPHFVGLHAFQLLPLIALATRRRGLTESACARTTIAAAFSYFALFVLMLVQALRGEPVFAPDGGLLAAYAAWLACSTVAIWLASAAGMRRIAATV
jgi:hypothetical protein